MCVYTCNMIPDKNYQVKKLFSKTKKKFISRYLIMKDMRYISLWINSIMLKLTNLYMCHVNNFRWNIIFRWFEMMMFHFSFLKTNLFFFLFILTLYH